MRFGLFPRLMFVFFLFLLIFATIGVVSYVVNKKTLAEWATRPLAPGEMHGPRGDIYARVLCKDAPTILFLTGLGTSSIEWWALQNTLSTEFSTITYDRPGYTWSFPNSTSTVEQNIEIINDLKAECPQSKKLILVGHNLGANLLKRILDRQPDLAYAAVFIDPLVSTADVQETIEHEWFNKFIDQTSSLRRYAIASHFGIFRFINITPYEVPNEIRPHVINNMAQISTAQAAQKEYAEVVSPKTTECARLRATVVSHNAEQNIELMKSFGAPDDIARKIESIWEQNGKNFVCGEDTQYLAAKKSVFDIHLQEPELIIEAIKATIP